MDNTTDEILIKAPFCNPYSTLSLERQKPNWTEAQLTSSIEKAIWRVAQSSLGSTIGQGSCDPLNHDPYLQSEIRCQELW